MTSKNKEGETLNSVKEICPKCQTEIKSLKHTISCECGTKIKLKKTIA